MLRAANSVSFNRTGQEISTVSRAIVLLGFETVRTIGVSLTVLDALLHGATRERLLRIMRESVFVATQARLLAREQGMAEPEAVFVAGLLQRLGDMAFWCFTDEAGARAMEQALATDDRPAPVIEREVLGFPLRQLAGHLARNWHLGELVENALQARQDATQGPIGCIRTGQRLESLIRDNGWHSKDTGAGIRRFAGAVGIPETRFLELVAQARDESTRVAEAFGIPTPSEQPSPREAAPEPPAVHEPAPVLQLKILRELSVVMRDQPDTHTVLEMIMEGLHRGVGLDRTLIAIYNQSLTGLRVKYSVGDTDGTVTGVLGGDLAEPELGVVRRVLQQQRQLQLMDLESSDPLARAASRFQRGIGGLDAVLAPLVIRGRAIGLIHVDRIPSQRLLDAEAVASILHFGDQANLALEHITA